MPAEARPLPLPGIVAWHGGEPVLVGGRCAGCGTHAFPRPDTCPLCGRGGRGGRGGVEAVELPTRGEVWTWTIQHFPPKPPFRGPQPFEPFALAYVDLGPVRVEARLAGRHVGNWAIGDRVVLAVEPLPGEDPASADARWAFVFQPEPEPA